jgi:periplasmic divalent cation tolerance protein
MEQQSHALTLFYVPMPNKESAQKMAHILLDERLIACANIMGEMLSLYDWNGVREESHEVVVLLKTSQDKKDAAMQRVHALHPYEIPCILCFDAVQTHPPFAQWIRKQTE